MQCTKKQVVQADFPMHNAVSLDVFLFDATRLTSQVTNILLDK